MITNHHDSTFQLHHQLQADSLPVIDLALCTVRLIDDQRFPWALLVPRRGGMVEVLDLEPDDQQLLWDEVRQVAGVMQGVYSPDKLNIAALGNVVSQLHVHVIARFESDPAWPAPVWGVGKALPYSDSADAAVARLRQALDSA